MEKSNSTNVVIGLSAIAVTLAVCAIKIRFSQSRLVADLVFILAGVVFILALITEKKRNQESKKEPPKTPLGAFKDWINVQIKKAEDISGAVKPDNVEQQASLMVELEKHIAKGIETALGTDKSGEFKNRNHYLFTEGLGAATYVWYSIAGGEDRGLQGNISESIAYLKYLGENTISTHLISSYHPEDL